MIGLNAVIQNGDDDSFAGVTFTPSWDDIHVESLLTSAMLFGKKNKHRRISFFVCSVTFTSEREGKIKSKCHPKWQNLPSSSAFVKSGFYSICRPWKYVCVFRFGKPWTSRSCHAAIEWKRPFWGGGGIRWLTYNINKCLQDCDQLSRTRSVHFFHTCKPPPLSLSLSLSSLIESRSSRKPDSSNLLRRK